MRLVKCDCPHFIQNVRILLRFSMVFDLLHATEIVIFIIFSRDRKSSPSKYKASDSYLHPYLILYHFVLKRPHFRAMDNDIEYVFSHRFFSHKGNKHMGTGFHRFSENNSHRFQYWRIDSILQTVTSSGD